MTSPFVMPIAGVLRHNAGYPRLQYVHVPHDGAHEMTTWSPGSSWVTPEPTASTTPEPSSPRTMGIGMPVCEPSYACRQLWHTPLATIRTRTSPNRGSSSSSSIICIGSRGLMSTGELINMKAPPQSCARPAPRSARRRTNFASRPVTPIL